MEPGFEEEGIEQNGVVVEIELEGIVSSETIELARKGEIYPHLICGVDVYRTPEIAEEDGVEIDRSRPYFSMTGEAKPHFLSPETGMYFSGRYYRVINLLDLEDYDPHTTVSEVKERMKELKAKGAGFLTEKVLEVEDSDAAYVLTPLTDEEMSELMKPE